MRPIDADALSDVIKSLEITVGGENIFPEETKQSILNEIDTAPTIIKNFGYIRARDEWDYIADRLKSQGADIVFVENDAKNILPAVLSQMKAGDSLYLFNIWHLSRDTSKLAGILEQLQSNKVNLIVDGKYLDLEDEQTQFEIRHAMELHNEMIAAFKKDMDAFKEWKTKRKAGD